MKKVKNKDKLKLIDKYCKETGILLIILGIISVSLSMIFSFEIGTLLIFVGVFSLIFRRKYIILIMAILLILAGIWNIVLSSGDLWFILGIFQIYWGIKEIKRYNNIGIVKHKKIKEGFVWWGLRIGFLALIFEWGFSFVSQFYINYTINYGLATFITIFRFFIIFFVLVLSIIHLTKYKKKTLPILAIVFSLLLLLISIWALIYVSSEGYSNVSIEMENECLNFCNGSELATYYLIDYDPISDSMTCYCTDSLSTVYEEKVLTSKQ